MEEVRKEIQKRLQLFWSQEGVFDRFGGVNQQIYNRVQSVFMELNRKLVLKDIHQGFKRFWAREHGNSILYSNKLVIKSFVYLA